MLRRRHLLPARQAPAALEPALAAARRLMAAEPAAAGATGTEAGGAVEADDGDVVGAAALLLLDGEVVVPPPDDHHPPVRVPGRRGHGARVRVPAHAVVRRGLRLPRRHPPLQPAPPHVELPLLRPRRPLLTAAAAAAAAPKLLRECVGEGSLPPRRRLDPALDPHPGHVRAHRAVVPLLLDSERWRRRRRRARPLAGPLLLLLHRRALLAQPEVAQRLAYLDQHRRRDGRPGGAPAGLLVMGAARFSSLLARPHLLQLPPRLQFTPAN